MSEQVLVFPSSLLDELGSFEGYYEQAGYYANAIRNSDKLLLMDRSLAEKDENFKQLIPYCVFGYDNKYFVFQRTKKSGEERLKGNLSIGLGGHLNEMDYLEGLRRELAEEIDPCVEYQYMGMTGVLNDSSNSVGRVHFGIVHFFVLPILSEPIMKLNEEALEAKGFWSVEELYDHRDSFENWSKMIIEFLWENK